MMSLHEINQTLIRRGMPKHEWLVWVENEEVSGVYAPEWHLCCNDTGRAIDGESEGSWRTHQMFSKHKQPPDQQAEAKQMQVSSTSRADIERAIAASNRAGTQSWDTVILKLMQSEAEAKQEEEASNIVFAKLTAQDTLSGGEPDKNNPPDDGDSEQPPPASTGHTRRKMQPTGAVKEVPILLENDREVLLVLPRPFSEADLSDLKKSIEFLGKKLLSKTDDEENANEPDGSR